MKEEKKLSLPASLLIFLSVLSIIIIGMKAGFGAQMSIFMASLVAIIFSFIFKTQWKDIQNEFEENAKGINNPVIIILLVGVLVGMWLAGGGIQSLIYYGLKFVSPAVIVPLTFLLCSLTSIFTGSSYSSIATMGLAMLGVAINLGISEPLIVGAIVSGSFLGDKMSPMSDTTNLAPAMAGTNLYSHIGSMMYTTVPAAIICLVLYSLLGINHAKGGTFDSSAIQTIMEALDSNYNISILCLIPLVLLLVLSALKIPAILAMGITAGVSVVCGLLLQPDANLMLILGSAMNGFKSETGVEFVDKLLTRGGVVSMIGAVASMYFASLMAAALKASGAIDTLMSILLKGIKSSAALIITTLGYCYAMLLATGAQMLGIIVPGKTMGTMYDKFNLDRKVLSRCLEDASTIGAALVPWANPSIYLMSVLGVGTGYIPYSFLCWIVPIFSIICALTKIGTRDSNGNPLWGKKNEKLFEEH